MFWLKTRMMKTTLVQSKRRFRRPLRTELLEDRCVPSTLKPTTFADGGLGSGSLRDVILEFNADTGTEDDTIQLEAGTYTLTIPNSGGRHETAGLTGDLNLNQTSHRWIIQGAGSSGENATIIDASQPQDRVFQIVNPGTQVVFQDLVIQGGLAQDDGSDGALAGTTDALGGGILNNGGNVMLDDVTVQNNVARGGDAASLGVAGHNANGGGVYSTGGALRLAGATLANNQASGGRGGDHNGGLYAGNGGLASGGGLYATGGSLDITDSMVTSNRGTGGTGGDGYSTQCYRTGGTSYTCTGAGGHGGSGTGGGLYVNGGSLTIASSSIATNQAAGGNAGFGGGNLNSFGQGGGLYNGGTLTVSNSTLSGNSASTFGGGIYNYSGGLAVSNSTLSGNSTDYHGEGGGIYNEYGPLAVSGSILSDNSAAAGGGIYEAYSLGLTVSNSTLSDNTAVEGGGIYTRHGTLTVSNSTLSDNTAKGSGGGILNLAGLTVSNSTLSGNTAKGSGAGIDNEGALTVSNSTLSGNSATFGSGGGLYVSSYSSPPVLHNTLIAGNFNGASDTIRDDVFGTLDRGGDYNLIGDGSGMSGLSNGVNGNQVGTADYPIDPLLGPLADNGGPTFTHALLPGSPAIGAGNNAYASEWDQRGPGYPRIVNGIIDIGAFEYQGDGAGPGALWKGLDNGSFLAALVSGLPALMDHPTSRLDAPFPGPATTPSLNRVVVPNEQVSVDPGDLDALCASFEKHGNGPTSIRQWDPESIQAVWSNAAVLTDETGIIG